MKKRIALSWSGGKDSCLSLARLVSQGYEVVCLMTTVTEEAGLTFAHDEKVSFIQRQSDALGIPLHFIRCSFTNYTDTFKSDLTKLKETYQLDGIAYGDIYIEGHREWGEEVAASVSLPALYPLWCKQEDSLSLLQSFIESGYDATIIRVRNDILDQTWLGHKLDASFLTDIQLTSSCPLGENGEYHTFVANGPLFQYPILFQLGDINRTETSSRLDLIPISKI